MRTSDFSAAPPLAQAQSMVTIADVRLRGLKTLWRTTGSAPGLVRRTVLLRQGRPAGVIAWFTSRSHAEAFQQQVASLGIAQVHQASSRGYSNGIWRAEDNRMAHVRRFTALRGERTPPLVSTPLDDTTNLRVLPVRTRQDLRRFTRLPEWDLRRRTHGVLLWEGTIRRWFRGKGPHAQHGAVELLLVEDGAGRVRGRTTLHTDDRMDAKLGEPTLLMGATDFADRDALQAMVAHAESEARARGRARLLGPVSLLPNQVGGVVTDGHEQPGFLDGPWNPEHHPKDWEAAGFSRIWEGATWICRDVAQRDPQVDFPGVVTPPGITIRHGHRQQLSAQLPILRQMLNDAFAELPYFTSIDAAELAAQTDGLAHLLDERLLLWVENNDGIPLAFVLAVPDLTDFVRSVKGADTPWNLARLWLTRKQFRRDAILIIKGTVPGSRGQGLMSLLSRELLMGLRAGGYRNLSVTFIENDNHGSAAQFVAMGGEALHRTTFYTKQVPQAAPTDPGSPAARLLSRESEWNRAPSAHNTQPWLVEAETQDSLILSWDPRRELTITDPTRRDLMLSLGAVAEAIRIVAADEELDAEVSWQVDTQSHQAARIRLRNGLPHRQVQSVAELLARQTARGPVGSWPDATEIAAITQQSGDCEIPHGLTVIPTAVVDELLPTASGHSLSGPGAPELAAWLRPSPRHPRYWLDGLSAQALHLSALQAHAITTLAHTPLIRRALDGTGLARQAARLSESTPCGTVVALHAAPDLPLESVAELGQALLNTWLELGRRGWAVHPLSELLDHPDTAARLHEQVSAHVGAPAQVYAVWRCGAPQAQPPRSPRLTDT